MAAGFFVCSGVVLLWDFLRQKYVYTAMRLFGQVRVGDPCFIKTFHRNILEKLFQINIPSLFKLNKSQ